jgi:hypothetical protein
VSIGPGAIALAVIPENSQPRGNLSDRAVA